MPQIIPLAMEFDIEKLSQSFLNLIHRHESLRTSFHMVNAQPVQRVHDNVEFQVTKVFAELFSKSDPPEAQSGGFLNEFICPFDLSCAPLLRAVFLETGEGQQYLLVDMHHIISDGTSGQILRDEFMALYDGKELPSLRIHYKDFAQWQKCPAQMENIKQQEAYWLKEFKGEIPILDLPIDFPRPNIQHFEGDVVSFDIEKQALTALGIIASQQGVTMYMSFLALFNVLLAKLCHQDDIIIGTASAGRRHADLEKIIGMFVNTLPLRNYPLPQKTFIDFLQEVKERTLAAFENQDYPFEDLVDKVVPDRNINRNPLFDVMFNFTESAETGEKEPITDHENEHGVISSKFDMTLSITKTGVDDFSFSIRYSTQLFKKETIEAVSQSFNEVISLVVENPTRKLSEINITAPNEMAEVLIDSSVGLEDLENE
jgi:hypothetical protein